MRKDAGLTIFFLALCLFSSSWAQSEVLPFHGEVDFTKQTLNLSIEQNNRAAVEAVFSGGEKNTDIHINVDHLRYREEDLSTQIQGNIRISDKRPGNFEGEFKSQYSLLNYKPIEELTSKFHVSGEKLYLEYLSFYGISLQGLMEFQHPFRFDMDVKLRDLDFQDITRLMRYSGDIALEGKVSGDIKAIGDPEGVVLKASLQSMDGLIDELDYESFYLEAGGLYPVINITSATITKKNGTSFTIDGSMDLKSDKSFRQQYRGLNFSPLVEHSASDSQWMIKRSGEERSGRTELKYMRRNKEDLTGSPQGEESDMFGVERIMEF